MPLEILKNTIRIGLSKPVTLLHMTDSHITRDDPFGGKQTANFDVDYKGCAEDYFFQAIRYAKENEIPILHTGDMIDSFSEGNFKFLAEHFKDVDYIYAAGNHDFCHKLGEAKEDYDYKWEKINDIAPYIKNNLYFYSRVIGGVNIVTLDNTYYTVTQGHIELLKAEVAKGYPILLAMHVPFCTPSLAQLAIESNEPAYVIGAPNELLGRYSEERRRQQTPDETTLRFMEYVKNQPAIKVLVTGHRHINDESMIGNRLPQFVTHGTYAGYVREIKLI